MDRNASYLAAYPYSFCAPLASCDQSQTSHLDGMEYPLHVVVRDWYEAQEGQALRNNINDA